MSEEEEEDSSGDTSASGYSPGGLVGEHWPHLPCSLPVVVEGGGGGGGGGEGARSEPLDGSTPLLWPRCTQSGLEKVEDHHRGVA